MSWIYLFVAAAFEVGWPLGFKLASVYPKWHWPIGTAYAVWTGLGASITVAIGILFFHDPASWQRLLCLFMIVAGVVGLKFL